MKPRIICHMLTTVDGRIDGKALRAVQRGTVYEQTGKELDGNAWVCGRVTMQQHYAEPGKFVAKTNRTSPGQNTFVAAQSESYAVAIDTRGTLLWSGADLDGDHLVCVVSEQVSPEYLDYLGEKAISFIVTGKSTVDLKNAVEILHSDFSIRTLLLEGGGKINGAFLEAGLLDEVSLLIAPGIDGREGVASLFDRPSGEGEPAIPMQLRSVQQLDQGMVWIRYDVL